MTSTGRALQRYLPAAALFVALIVAWQVAVSVFRLREYLLPAPLTVALAMMGGELPWLRHLAVRGYLAEETTRVRLVAALAPLAGQRQGARGGFARLVEATGGSVVNISPLPRRWPRPWGP